MTHKQHDYLVGVLILTFAIMFIVYSAMYTVFAWRNPKANNMSYLRDMGSVITLQKLDKYQ